MEKEELKLDTVLNELYKGREITEKMKDISVELIGNDFSLSNVFGSVRDITYRYVCTNPDGEQGIIDVIRCDGYNIASNSIKRIKVMLPFNSRTLKRFGDSAYSFLTENKVNNKKGVIEIDPRSKQIIDEKYDEIEKVDAVNYIVKIGDKSGGINTYNKVYNIPVKYDEIKYNNYNYGSYTITYVRQKDKWGAYCYALDYHGRYDVELDRGWEQSYIKKRFVPPIFDNVRFAHFNKNNRKIYLYVTLGKKIGVLDAYDREIVVPIVFDEIYFGTHDINNSYCYGYINGDRYMYDGDFFYKQDEVYLPQEYHDAKNIIENYGVSEKAKVRKREMDDDLPF